MATQTGSIDLKAAKAAADIAKDTSAYFWTNTQDSGAGEGVGAHITEVPSATFISNPSAGGGNVLIDSNSVDIRDGVTTLATFGAEGAVVGENASGKSRTEITSAGMRIIRNDSGSDKQIANLGYGKSNNEGVEVDSPYYTFGDRKTTNTAYSSSSTYSVGDLCIYNNKTYVCISAITTPEAWNGNHWKLAYGAYSTAEGSLNIASGLCSHAEGKENIAIAYSSHAEGLYTQALEAYAHAEGMYTFATGARSHSEGTSTFASGYTAHSEGTGTHANGDYSHAQNYYTEADSDYQTVIGKYNNQDTHDTYAFIIGNGTADNARSNALTVDWSGNVDIPSGASYKINNSSLFITRTATASGTVNANTNARITGNITSVSGYTPIAIQYVQSNAGANATITEFGLYNSNTQVSSVVRNVGSSQISVTHTYGILYVRSELV